MPRSAILREVLECERLFLAEALAAFGPDWSSQAVGRGWLRRWIARPDAPVTVVAEPAPRPSARHRPGGQTVAKAKAGPGRLRPAQVLEQRGLLAPKERRVPRVPLANRMEVTIGRIADFIDVLLSHVGELGDEPHPQRSLWVKRLQQARAKLARGIHMLEGRTYPVQRAEIGPATTSLNG